MIRCNNCMALFKRSQELELIDLEGEYIQACPNCQTDGYLMDLEEEGDE